MKVVILKPKKDDCKMIQVHRYKVEKYTQTPSNVLKRVNLRVSQTRFKHKLMFGTVMEKKNGTYQDPCAGDSGGPLMYQVPGSGRWVIIGKLEFK